MDKLLQYITYRIDRLKKTDRLITLIFILIGAGIATWKYSFYSAIATVFIFTSALTLFDFLLNLKFYLFPLKKKSSFGKGQKLFTWVLISIIVIIQCILWDKRITILSISVGLAFWFPFKIIKICSAIFR